MRPAPLALWAAAPLALMSTFLTPTTGARADNGALAYAKAIAPITVDGDLSDWDADAPVYELDTVLVGEPQARFRLAYNAQDKALYVAMVITDDTHILAQNSLDTWYLKDSHILYFDPEHSKGGSGRESGARLGHQSALCLSGSSPGRARRD